MTLGTPCSGTFTEAALGFCLRAFAAANTEPQRLAISVFTTIEGDPVAEPGWRVFEVAPGPWSG